MGWIAAALVLALLAGLGAWLLWPGDGERPDTTADTSGTEQTEGPSASEEPTTDPSPADGPAQQRAPIRAFVEDYFSRVISDPESTFAMLTPEFQAESGGYEGYAGFWSTIASATAYDIQADPRALTTSGRTTTRQGLLQLERRGEEYLIAGEG